MGLALKTMLQIRGQYFHIIWYQFRVLFCALFATTDKVLMVSAFLLFGRKIKIGLHHLRKQELANVKSPHH